MNGDVTVRIRPLPQEAWSDDQKSLMSSTTTGPARRAQNLYATLVRSPGLFRRWGPFGSKLLRGSLPARDRELAILRTGWLCNSTYEWVQHVVIARDIGLDQCDIERVAGPLEGAGWNSQELALLRVVDELHDSARIGASTWETIAAHYNESELVELVMLVGNYHLVAFVANSFGTPLEPDVESVGVAFPGASVAQLEADS